MIPTSIQRRARKKRGVSKKRLKGKEHTSNKKKAQAREEVKFRGHTRDVSKTSEGDVDEEVASTALLKHHSQRGEDDGKDELKDIGAGKSHVCCSFS